jgi:hypothetical protein
MEPHPVSVAICAGPSHETSLHLREPSGSASFAVRMWSAASAAQTRRRCSSCDGKPRVQRQCPQAMRPSNAEHCHFPKPRNLDGRTDASPGKTWRP